MVTGPVTVGNCDAGAMVCTSVPAMLKFMVSAPVVLLASRIACLSEPAPLSSVLVTVKVVEAWAGFAASENAAISAASRRPRAIILTIVALFSIEVVISHIPFLMF